MNKRIIIAFLCLALVLIGMVLYLSHSKSTYSWSGTWDVSYFYTNDSNLVYRGVIELEEKIGRMNMQVWAPKSSRPEDILVESLGIQGHNLQAEIIHEMYKIDGGHLRESLELTLQDANHFTGHGKCLAYCAEGTENYSITWRGTRINKEQ